MFSQSCGLAKLGRKGATCWFEKRTDLVHFIPFFRNKTFLFVKVEKLKFSATLWFRISWNLTKFQLLWTVFIPPWIKCPLRVVWMTWNSEKFHKILNQTDAESFKQDSTTMEKNNSTFCIRSEWQNQRQMENSTKNLLYWGISNIYCKLQIYNCFNGNCNIWGSPVYKISIGLWHYSEEFHGFWKKKVSVILYALGYSWK